MNLSQRDAAGANRFVEVEPDDGRGVGIGQWIEHPNGWWSLRITASDFRTVGTT